MIDPLARLALMKKWGTEQVLRCKCGTVKSHSMWGQYGSAKCPTCRTECEVLDISWEEHDNIS